MILFMFIKTDKFCVLIICLPLLYLSTWFNACRLNKFGGPIPHVFWCSMIPCFSPSNPSMFVLNHINIQHPHHFLLNHIKFPIFFLVFPIFSWFFPANFQDHLTQSNRRSILRRGTVVRAWNQRSASWPSPCSQAPWTKATKAMAWERTLGEHYWLWLSR